MALPELYDRLILRHPAIVLLLIALVVAACGWQAQHFRLDASADSLVLEDDAALGYYRAILARYGAQSDDTWQLYDLVVDGVSLVANYRATFAHKLRGQDLDTLLLMVGLGVYQRLSTWTETVDPAEETSHQNVI